MVLEPPLHEVVQRLAQSDRISLSAKIRDLVLEALEVEEEVALAELAKERAALLRLRGPCRTSKSGGSTASVADDLAVCVSP